MVKLTDVVAAERQHLEGLECPEFPDPVLLPPRALSSSRVALISSAGLMKRSDDNVKAGTAEYRTIETTTRDRDVLLNHVSVNFDRTGFAEDINSVFPRERLNDLKENGVIEHAAKSHYSFMGATAPEAMQANVQELVTELKAQKINAVCLLPV